MAEDRFLGRRLISATRLERWERRIEAAVTAALTRHRTAALTALRASSPPDPFDLALWDLSVEEDVSPVVLTILHEAADSAVAFLALPPEVRARALGAIDVETEAATFVERIKAIGPTVAERLRQALNEGLRFGESIPKLSDRVQEAFAVGENRAEIISRTEVHGAAMRSGNESAGALQDSGTLLEKVWITAGDERVRDWHADADEQTVPYDEPFIVDGEELMYPGDPAGSPENVIQCRCDCLYQEVTAEGDVVAGDLQPAEEG